MAHHAFICHASADRAVAQAVCAALESTGISCWIAPRDIAPGAEWAAEITNAIVGSRVLVLIFSSHANESNQVKREVERAIGRRRAVLPLRIEDVPPSASLEYFLSAHHWLDACAPPLERHLQELSAKVKALLSSADAAAGDGPPAFDRRTSAASTGPSRDTPADTALRFHQRQGRRGDLS